jgi:transposase
VGFYTDLSDAAWALVAPHLPPARPGGRPRTTDLRSVVNAILYLLRTGCQWRLMPPCFPPWGTVYHYFRLWARTGVWVLLHRALYERARAAAGRAACPAVVIMDGQSVKTTERGGVRGFDGHKGSVSTRAKPDGVRCRASSAYAASMIANAAVARRRWSRRRRSAGMCWLWRV